MEKEELKNKCTERAKIFQQAMESCKSSNPMDCIEWFADRIIELEKDKQYFSDSLDKQIEATLKLDKENEELKADNDARKFAMAMSEKVEKQLRNERNTFLAQNEQYEKDLIDLNEQLTKAKDHIKKLLDCLKQDTNDPQTNYYVCQYMDKAEQFLNSEVEK